MKRIVIAIDGPAASGKSSTARCLAQRLQYLYLDTGAMYRACAYAAQKAGIELNDISSIGSLLDNIDISVIQDNAGNKIVLNDVDISNEIRSEGMSSLASAISAIPLVRTKMVALQRKLGGNGGVVLDGRDIGTVVFPHAELKIFMIADVNERAKRRFEELIAKGVTADYQEVLNELKARDFNDSNRSIAPLKPAIDAITIDTSIMTLEQQVELIYNLACKKINSYNDIFLAEHSGFCFGVKRAIHLAIEAQKDASGKAVYTIGELIHNPQIVKQLDKQGIHVADNTKDIFDSIVIIRSHGITKSEEKLLRDQGNILIDATCPYVKRTHELIADMVEQDYPIWILGDAHHPEVIGMLSYGNEHTKVVSCKDYLDAQNISKLAIICQTTQKIENLQCIVERLIDKVKELRVFNTICLATSHRQESTRELARRCDLMIVIGGFNSSNTKMLHTICDEFTNCLHIETELGLNESMVVSASTIGITAGASTPDEMIIKVYNKIKQIKGEADFVKSIGDIPTFKEESC